MKLDTVFDNDTVFETR